MYILSQNSHRLLWLIDKRDALIVMGRLKSFRKFNNRGEVINGVRQGFKNSFTSKSFIWIHLKVVYDNFKLLDVTKLNSVIPTFQHIQ